MPTETKRLNEPSKTANNQLLPDLMKYDDAGFKISKLVSVMDELEQTRVNNQHLRYTEIDIEAERKSNRIAPDEMYIPQHIIDTNIRREQAKYIAYINSARRVVILHDMEDPSADSSVIEADFTNRYRYDGWQLPIYRCIDGMQQNGYGVLELVNDANMPGHLKFQDVAYGDFGYSLDTRDIQSAEMVTRRYYFTKTQLLALTNQESWKFNLDEVKKVVTRGKDDEINDFKETSLYKIEKVMFRKRGVVHVAWSCYQCCKEWLRAPVPLYLGRQTLDPVSGKWVKAFETNYPYFIAMYNITENVVMRQSKGRAYMDQDCQEGVSSLISSYVTAHRRGCGLYFSKDTEGDPNNDTITQSNDFFRQGKLINGKVRQFQVVVPGAETLGAIQALAGMNMQENSQIDYAANNRKDSRKTATEIQAAQVESQLLSTVQLALFSTFIKQSGTTFFDIVRSRILALLIKDVNPAVQQMYERTYQVRPAGDSDVIERQEKILRMQQTWPVVSNTAAATAFLDKMLQLLFPEDAPIYTNLIQQDQSKSTALAGCAHVLQGLIADPNQLEPEARKEIPQLKQLLQQITQVLQPQQQQKK